MQRFICEEIFIKYIRNRREYLPINDCYFEMSQKYIKKKI